MSYHVHKDDVKLAWLDNRDQVKLDLRKIMRRIENEVLTELEDQFLEGLEEGKVLELRPGETTLKNLTRKHSLALTEIGEDD